MGQSKTNNKNTNGSEVPANKKNPNSPDSPKTYGQEPPMVDPNTPEHPDNYEVDASHGGTDQSPLLH